MLSCFFTFAAMQYRKIGYRNVMPRKDHTRHNGLISTFSVGLNRGSSATSFIVISAACDYTV